MSNLKGKNHNDSDDDDNHIQHLLDEFAKLDEKDMVKLAARLSKMHLPAEPQQDHTEPPTTFAADHHLVSYCQTSPQEINLRGIMETAHLFKLQDDDVNKMFDALDKYIKAETKKLKDVKRKFQGGLLPVAPTEDIPGTVQENINKVMKSQHNIYLVDLLAKEKTVADVARMTNHTHQDLYLAVENHQQLVDSLAEKLSVERAEANRYTNPSSPSSSSSSSSYSQPKSRRSSSSTNNKKEKK